MKRSIIVLTIVLFSLNVFSQDELVNSILMELNILRNINGLPNVKLSNEFNERGKNHNDNLFVFGQKYVHDEYEFNDTIHCYKTPQNRYNGVSGGEVVQVQPFFVDIKTDTLANIFIKHFYDSKEGHKEIILSKQYKTVMISVNKYEYIKNEVWGDGTSIPTQRIDYYLTMFFY